jgi:hypothetical protein
MILRFKFPLSQLSPLHIGKGSLLVRCLQALSLDPNSELSGGMCAITFVQLVRGIGNPACLARWMICRAYHNDEGCV